MSDSASTFQKRLIDVQFYRAVGPFSNTNSNTVRLSGLRVSCAISMDGGIQNLGALDMRIYGMSRDMMNDLTFVNRFLVDPGNPSTVSVFAGTEAAGMTLVFSGPIIFAAPDYSSAPSVPLHVQSSSTYAIAMRAATTVSYSGAADVAVIMRNLASAMGKRFENGGVSGVYLNAPYLHGTLIDQANKVAQSAGIEWAIVNDVLAIWPRNGARGGEIPVISPESGLLGYPTLTPIGVDFYCIFNPSITPMGRVKIESSIPPANGVWNIKTMSHSLESETPGGAWFSQVSSINDSAFIRLGAVAGGNPV